MCFSDNALTEPSLWMLFIASPSSSATLRILSFGNIFSSGMGIVLVTTTSLTGALLSLSTAGGEKIAWVAATYISLAPASFSANMVSVMVPAVSIMSSMIMTFFPSTLPMMFVMLALLWSGLLFSIIVRGTPSSVASLLAFFTPPASGDATTRSGIFFFSK